MFLKSVFVLLGLAMILATSNGLILRCNYIFTSQGDLGSLYTCAAAVVSIGDSRYVTEVTDDHLVGQNNSNVQALVYNQTINFTPRNISSFFPNLRVFVASGISTSELRRADLEGFRNLESLKFGNNNLREIDNDLFINNPLLTSIYFENNPIRHIAHNAFDHLSALHTLFMFNTACINRFAANDRNEVERLQFSLLLECPPTFRMTEERIVHGSELSDKVQSQIDNEFQTLYARVKAIEEQQSVLEQRVEVLEQNSTLFGRLLKSATDF